MCDMNFTIGGRLGYSSEKTNFNLKVPSSKGVSEGPKTIAFQTIMLSSVGAPLTPEGGSSCILYNINTLSFITRLI